MADAQNLRAAPDPRPILVTGATGYVGGRLVSRLLDDGHRVRVMVRTPAKVRGYDWADDVEVVQGDVLEPDQVEAAVDGCRSVAYLVHSLGGDDVHEREERAARHVQEAADAAGVDRIVYLGGIVPDQPDDEELSPHLASRRNVGRVLAAGRTPVTELRAAVIIGSGSISFEMLRYLTDVLPVMTTPRWVRTKCQPIAIRDVLQYLAAALVDDSDRSLIVPIGGTDVLTYEEMMQVYAEEAGLKRRVILPVPVLTPKLSSLWVGLVTPLPTGVAADLIESLVIDVVVDPSDEGLTAAEDVFDVEPTDYRTAIQRAIGTTASTRWSDAGVVPAEAIPGDPDWAGGKVFEDRKVIESEAAADDLFWAVARIGGDHGYYVMNWAWAVRGVLDSVVGGPGMRRGRRHPENLRVGDSLDWWRVIEVERPHCLELKAEMLLPGQGWLRFEIEELGSTADRRTKLTQVASFAPRGLWGRLYWGAMWPFHLFVFGRMAAAISAAAENRADGDPRPTEDIPEPFAA